MLKTQPISQIKDNPTGPVQGQNVPTGSSIDNDPKKFPYESEKPRLDAYDYFEKLFYGDHYNAFRLRINDDEWNKAHAMLRYVRVNMAGLISKVCADMLFSEPVKLKAPDEGDQEFLEALIRENKLHQQFYESALSNSYIGDALFKIRIGKRNPADKKPTVIIEDITPSIYFPKGDDFNVRAVPAEEELAWQFEIGKDKYVRKEIHKSGKIINEVWKLKGGKMTEQVDLAVLGIEGLKPEEETKIEESLLVHIPNWKTGRRRFGISDYFDLDAIFYAINNRMTKIDNVLDKHTDPILFVPEGVLDEDGNVSREALNMVEFPAGTGEEGKPEYIVWNANLESALSEVDRLVEFMFMVSETSPDILGMGKGQSDSGRALKLKILRTIAKVARKKIYYDYAIQELMYRAQKLAKAWNLEVDGVKLTKEPTRPEITWADGLPIDELEQVEIENKRLDAGTQDTAGAIMNIEGLEEEPAKEKAAAIKKERELKMPTQLGKDNPFSKKTKEDLDPKQD